MTYLARMTCHPGAVRLAAPELLSGEEPTSATTTQSDMYSFGNIMLQILTGKVPWCHLTRDFQISYQVVIAGKIHPRPHNVYVTDPHWDFMTRCWSTSLTDRPLVEEAVQFVDSTLHPSTSTKTPSLSISSANFPDKIRVRCSACNVIFRKENFRRHLNEVHGFRVKHSCLRCGMSFSRKSSMRTHRCRST